MHCRIIRRQQSDVGALELRHHSFRPRRNGQRNIAAQHGLNDLGAALKINQIDAQAMFFEETLFLSDVGLAELSGEKRGYPYFVSSRRAPARALNNTTKQTKNPIAMLLIFTVNPLIFPNCVNQAINRNLILLAKLVLHRSLNPHSQWRIEPAPEKAADP